jgi:hypothetical protein
VPSWLTEALKLLGLSTPGVYAFATYGCFRWLDREASVAAKEAISAWIIGRGYDKAAARSAIVELFDRVYAKPLLSLNILIRSAILSIAAIAVMLVEFKVNYSDLLLLFRVDSLRMFGEGALVRMLVSTSFNVISDYMSLFVVRYILAVGSKRPIIATTIGPIFGVVAVFMIFTIRSLANFVFTIIVNGWNDVDNIKHAIEAFYDNFPKGTMFIEDDDIAYSAAALVVHVWMPLLGASAIVLAILNYFRFAVSKTQWFLKRGRDHPLEAIGLVAAVIVFLSTGILRTVF